jgi:phage baseplate assembly protein W
MQSIDTSNFSYLGTTIRFPYSLTSRGTALLSSGSQCIVQSILFILGTRKGSFWGYPNIGSNLHLLLFEKNDNVFQSLAKTYIREAIESQEQRVQYIDCGFLRTGPDSISIIVRYRILSSSEVGQLDFPFSRRSE